MYCVAQISHTHPCAHTSLTYCTSHTRHPHSQGLRTLELCVDNLQPDFLFDHIQPVRAELMQALWAALRLAPDAVAQVSFRVLGKFGGSNRKMLQEPQRVCRNFLPFVKFSVFCFCLFFFLLFFFNFF